MWSSPVFWIGVALTVFWALGAYNRLMRLRSAVLQAFGGFDVPAVRLLAVLEEAQAVATSLEGAAQLSTSERVQGEQDRAALRGAMTQLSASLAVARAKPLQSNAIAALVAAREVVRVTWLSVLPQLQDASRASQTLAPQAEETAQGADDAPAVASAPSVPLVPAAAMQTLWAMRYSDVDELSRGAATQFNAAVASYNAAIAQFPASILAWIFGFKAAGSL